PITVSNSPAVWAIAAVAADNARHATRAKRIACRKRKYCMAPAVRFPMAGGKACPSPRWTVLWSVDRGAIQYASVRLVPGYYAVWYHGSQAPGQGLIRPCKPLFYRGLAGSSGVEGQSILMTD